MVLSNFRIARLMIFAAILAAASCSLFRTTESTEQLPQAKPISDLPFDAREPEVFSAEIVISSGDVSSRRAFYRKPGGWRLDIYNGEEIAWSAVNTGRETVIDHRRKVFAEVEEKTGGAEPDFVQEMTVRLLRKRRYSSFETLGQEEHIRKYRVSISGHEGGDIVLYYDESLKMVVRQEFLQGEGEQAKPVLTFEMKNISFDVPDTVFAVPEGYRKVSETEYYSDRP